MAAQSQGISCLRLCCDYWCGICNRSFRPPSGAYSAKADPDDDTKAVAVWRNDTVVFYATGAKNDIQRFYQQFPL